MRQTYNPSVLDLDIEAELQQLLAFISQPELNPEFDSDLEIKQMFGAAVESNLIPLNDAPNQIRNRGWKRGIYVIFNQRNRVYVGKSMELPERIAKHRLCLTHLKVPLTDFRVKVFHYPNANQNTLLAREREYRQKYPGLFSHLKDTEIENLIEVELEEMLPQSDEVEFAEVDIPGISGRENHWFPSQGEARKAAIKRSRELGLGYGIAHDPNPTRGLPHYHIVDAQGRRISGHFFYGKKPPRRVLKGKRQREAEVMFEIDIETELQQFVEYINPSKLNRELNRDLEIEEMAGAAVESNIIPLNDAPNLIRNKGWKRGIYIIFNRQNRVYVGKSIDLAERIGKHRLCLTHLKVPLGDFRVKVFHYPNDNQNMLLAREREYRQKYPGVFRHLKDTESENLIEVELEQLVP